MNGVSQTVCQIQQLKWLHYNNLNIINFKEKSLNPALFFIKFEEIDCTLNYLYDIIKV